MVMPTVDFARSLKDLAPGDGAAVAVLLPTAAGRDGAAPLACGLPPLARALGGPPDPGAVGKARTVLGVLPDHPLILSGLGPAAAATAGAVEDAAGEALQAAQAAGCRHLILILPAWTGLAEAAAGALGRAGVGAILANWPADPLRNRDRRSLAPPLEANTLVGPGAAAAEAAWPALAAEIAAIGLARDLVNRPSNEKRPDRLAADIAGLAGEGLTATIVDAKRLAALGAGALLAVGQGSAVPPCLVRLDWNGTGDPDAPAIALIGKGITFDTGGITLKPANGMWDMRQDMAGAAAVVGAMHLLAAVKAPVRVTGIVACAENMIGGGALRPGDVVTALDGTTIEIRDTDAEGRLALADAIAYARREVKPTAIVDIATLTGSVVAALGRGFAGLFVDEALAPALSTAAAETRARLWRLPFDDYYRDKLASDIADLSQVGADEERADTCFAAAFLKAFAGPVPLAHIDTATQHWAEDPAPTCPMGATGFGVTVLAAAARRLGRSV